MSKVPWRLFAMNCLIIILALLTCCIVMDIRLKYALEGMKESQKLNNSVNKSQNFPRMEKCSLEMLKSVQNLYELLASQKTCQSLERNAQKSLSMIEFIRNNFPRILNSSLVEFYQFESSVLLSINGSSRARPFLVMFDFDAIVDSRIRLFSPWHIDFDLIQRSLTGVGSISPIGTTCATLQALSQLLEDSSYIPSRSFHIFLQRNTDLFDYTTQERVFQHFRNRSVHLDFILESPGVVLQGGEVGLNTDVAMIGVTRRRTLIAQYDHTSEEADDFDFLPLTTLISMVSRNLPNHFSFGIENEIMDSLIPHSNYWNAIRYANRWLFDPFLSEFFARNSYFSRVVQTQICVLNQYTLPMLKTAAILSEVIHPHDNVFAMVAARKKTAENMRVVMKPLDIFNPHKGEYSSKTDAFKSVQRAFEHSFPGSVAVPADSFGPPKARQLEQLTESIYQFSPAILGSANIPEFATHKERLSLSHYCKLIHFYQQLFD